MIHLEPITEDNWREALSVSEEQKRYVASPMVLLARAYAYRDSRSCACMICRDETPVCMALYYGCPERNAYGNTAQLRLRVSAVFLPHFFSLKNQKYIQYSFVFQTLNWRKNPV